MRYLSILFFLIIFTNGFAQDTGAVKGKLIDKENYNKPLAFANIFNAATEEIVYSDIDGTYNFDDLTPGEYKLTYSFVGYQTVSKLVRVETGKVTEINMVLEAAKPTLKKVVMVDPDNANTSVALN